MGIDYKSDFECDDLEIDGNSELLLVNIGRRHSKSCDNFTSSNFEQDSHCDLTNESQAYNVNKQFDDDNDDVFRVEHTKFVDIDLNDPLDDCIQKFQHKIMQIKLEQNIPWGQEWWRRRFV